jgi:hypothetical protein
VLVHLLEDILEERGLLVLGEQEVGLFDVLYPEGSGVASMRPQVQEVADRQ